jgi:hypothetical protein
MATAVARDHQLDGVDLARAADETGVSPKLDNLWHLVPVSGGL